MVPYIHMTQEYKNQIIINTGKSKKDRERQFIFSTDQNVLDYFTQRNSITKWDFPKYCDGTVEEYDEGGGWMGSWMEFYEQDFFDCLKIQNIESISVNGKNINKEVCEIAKSYGAKVLFPMMYHAQFIFEDKTDWVFNWYPTTGTLTKQRATNDFYRIKKIGVYKYAEDALEACK